jgi:hypothetical protein
MEKVNGILKQKKIGEKDLSVELQKEVSNLKEIIVKYNLAVDEFNKNDDKDAETEKELDEMQDRIVKLDTSLAKKISDYFDNKAEEAVEQKAAEQKAAEQKPQQNEQKPVEQKKKDNSVTWLILGGVLFAATLGVVNLMKKKA